MGSGWRQSTQVPAPHRARRAGQEEIVALVAERLFGALRDHFVGEALPPELGLELDEAGHRRVVAPYLLAAGVGFFGGCALPLDLCCDALSQRHRVPRRRRLDGRRLPESVVGHRPSDPLSDRHHRALGPRRRDLQVLRAHQGGGRRADGSNALLLWEHVRIAGQLGSTLIAFIAALPSLPPPPSRSPGRWGP
jgi:hypothetical protein